MSITLKQLQALSEEFEFDYNEARKFLGHSEPKKRGRPSKKVDNMVDTDSDQHSISPERRRVKDVRKPPTPPNDQKTKKQDTPSSETKKQGTPRSETKKQGTPRSETKKQDTPRSETKKQSRAPANKSETPKAGGRPPSGYNLFVRHQGKSITESAKQWKELSDAKRASWNSKAAQKEKSIWDIFG